MRITCFVLGTLCLIISAVWVGIGMLDLAGGSSTSSPTVANLRMTQTAVDTSRYLDDFGPASTFAQIFAIAGIAWMIGATAFAPRQTATATAPAPATAPATGSAAAAEQRQWQQQPQQQPSQQYAPQWQQQAPTHQHPDQQS